METQFPSFYSQASTSVYHKYSKSNSIRGFHFLCCLLLVLTWAAMAQVDSYNIQPGSVTSSFAHFYDTGGETANYQDNENITMTIYPEDSTQKICVTFHEFETQAGSSADILYVYDGNSTAAPLIAQLSGVNYGTLSSSAADGSLTFQFVSNSSTNSLGWNASITTDNTPEDITMIGDATWIISSGNFYDNGGKNSNYSDSKNNTVTLIPSNTEDKLSVTFHEFETQGGTSADILYVYDGNSTSAPLIARLSGVNYGTISSTASDGSLTFHFISNATTNDFGWHATISTHERSKDITMLASRTYTTSSGRFYDNGGAHGDYAANKDETVTILPESAGEKLTVTFHECDIAAGDVLYAFDGSDASAPLIASITGANYGTVRSSASDGALTFQFVSDGATNGEGWYASISGEAVVEDVTMLANGSFTVSGKGRFYDNGGPENNYEHNQNVVTTIYPENTADKLSVTFHSFNTQADFDILHVYDGNSVSAPLIGSYSGERTVFTVTSSATDGSLTFNFVSNNATNDDGWYASITNSAAIPSYDLTSSTSHSIPTGSSAFFYDSGGPDAIYAANENNTITFTPENNNNKLSVVFDYFQTWNASDYLEVFDGNSITAPILATLHSNAGYGTITASDANATGSLTFRFVSNNSGNSGGWAALITADAGTRNFALPGAYELPSGTVGFFYDHGGPGGNYVANVDEVTTISPENSGDKLSVSFSYLQTWNASDYLEVRDGNSITAPLLATLHSNAGYGTITASDANATGSLTFKFVSNNSGNSGGWAAAVTTESNPETFSLPGSYSLPSGTIGYFYDSGGPAGNYVANQDEVTTISPANSGDKLSVSFSYFQTWNASDFLEVRDGNSITAPLLATLHSHAGYGTITASDANATGSLTFRFVSNNSGNSGGWAAAITSDASPKNFSLPGIYGLPSETIGFYYDSGGPNGNYVANQDEVTTINPANSGDRVSASFNHFQTWNASDFLEIYDGNNLAAPLLGTFSISTNPGTVTASEANSTGSLTFRFVSNNSGNSEGWAAVITSTPGPTGIAEDDDANDIPDAFGLSRNYPNPFNPSTTINYQLPQSAQVELSIFNIVGQKVVTLVSDHQTAGEKTVIWDGRNADGKAVASGIYVYRLQAGDFVRSYKMLLTK